MIYYQNLHFVNHYYNCKFHIKLDKELIYENQKMMNYLSSKHPSYKGLDPSLTIKNDLGEEITTPEGILFIVYLLEHHNNINSCKIDCLETVYSYFLILITRLTISHARQF